MNREDIIRIARKAGAIPIYKRPKELAVVGNENIERFFQAAYAAGADDEREAAKDLWNAVSFTDQQIADHISAAVSAEREACAQVCEEEGLLWGQRYAAAIRARSNT